MLKGEIMTDMSYNLIRPQKGSMAEWATFSEVGEGLAVGRVSQEWFASVSDLVRAQIFNDTAPPEVLETVQRHNPDSFWGMFRKTETTHELIGVYGQLLLNPKGHEALLIGALNRLNPSLHFLAEFRERASAVYMWCVVAKKRGAMLQAALVKQLQDQHGMPYYAVLATPDSFRAGKHIGFQPVTPHDDRIGGLFKLPDTLPILRSSAAKRAVVVKAVETAGEFSHVFALRAATFVAEQNCPITEEFDGNDFSAQHVIAYLDGMPAASMRIRYFASFVKWERLCVLARFRKTRISDELLRFATEIAQQKGFTQVYFQAEAALRAFWEKRGFRRISERTVQFSGREYLEFAKDIPTPPGVLTLDTDPMVLNRVEGHWERPGVLDRSAERTAA
jgi:predicted GNAT family N-acyltransferase